MKTEEEHQKERVETLCQELLEAAKERYGFLKLGDAVHYMAPEIRPKLQSDQVRALAYAVAELVLQMRQEADRDYEPRKRDDY